MTTNGSTKRSTIGLIAMGTLVLLGMLITLFVPTQNAEAQTSYTGPCPHYAIQDVFDDPNGNWDGDRVTNGDELYNGLNPCLVDDGNFCNSGGNPLCNYPHYVYLDYPTACANHVTSYPHGDYDGDGVSNRVEEAYGASPCHHPCPHATHTDLALNPYGNWDGDSLNNTVDFERGWNPCVADVYNYNPCPNYTLNDVNHMPGYDWDRDGVTNRAEVQRGTNPCFANIQRLPHVTNTQRLPHVSYTPPPRVVYTVQLPAAVCPVNYPYYHPHTRLCYANPVTGQFR